MPSPTVSVSLISKVLVEVTAPEIVPPAFGSAASAVSFAVFKALAVGASVVDVLVTVSFN